VWIEEEEDYKGFGRKEAYAEKAPRERP